MNESDNILCVIVCMCVVCWPFGGCKTRENVNT